MSNWRKLTWYIPLVGVWFVFRDIPNMSHKHFDATATAHGVYFAIPMAVALISLLQ